MKNEAYWREDKQDDYIHFCFECPEIVAAKKIGKGTIEAANASGHVRPCQKCNIAKYRINQEAEKLREIRKKEKEEEIKKAREDEKKKIMPSAVSAAFIVLMICIFLGSSYIENQSESQYNLGYNAGIEEGQNSAYELGKEDGKAQGYEDGYSDGSSYAENWVEEEYSKGYLQGYFDCENGYYPAENEPLVFISKEGYKYHDLGCKYLKQSCISIGLYHAQDEGYIACDICNPPE